MSRSFAWRSLLLFFAFLLSFASARAGSFRPFMVENIVTTPVPGSSSPRWFTGAGNRLFFKAFAPHLGTELWVTDGTSANTRLTRDVNPGSGSGIDASGRSAALSPSHAGDLIAFKDLVFFTGDDAAHGREVWKSDGTTDGTVILKDIVPGSGSAAPIGFAAAGDLLYFTVNFPSSAPPFTQLWVTDGTTPGTRRIEGTNAIYLTAGTRDYVLGYDGAGLIRIDAVTGAATPLRSLTAATGDAFASVLLPGGKVVLLAGGDFYATDGTPAGTVLLKDFLRSQQTLVTAGGLAYATADGADTFRRALYVTDGTPAGTRSLTNLVRPENTTAFGDKLLFTAEEANGFRRDLYVTDGTEAGTVKLTSQVNWPSERSIAVLNGVAYFALATSPSPSLWRTDGTPAGTQKVADISASLPLPGEITAFNGALVFAGNDASLGVEPFRGDGTPAGTALLRDIHVSDASSTPMALEPALGALFFMVNAGSDLELWRSAGGDARKVKTLGAARSSIDDPHAYGECEHLLYFTTNRVDLWRSDGTADGTFVIADSFSSVNSAVCTAAGMLYGSSSALRLTHGTAATTTTVRTGAALSLTATPYGALFSAADAMGASRLWRTDGTPSGTSVVSSSLRFPTDLHHGTSLTYFVGTDDKRGLWRTDGTDAGTVRLVPDIPLTFKIIGVVDDVVYFTVTPAIQLWRSDGTVGGTHLVREFPGESIAPELVKFRGSIYLPITSPNSGFGLWRTDGTAGGTVLVASNPSSYSYFLNKLTVAGGVLFFSSDWAGHGRELWAFDGTNAELVADIRPGSGDSSPNFLTVMGTSLYFSAANVFGTELWAVWTAAPPRGRAIR